VRTYIAVQKFPFLKGRFSLNKLRKKIPTTRDRNTKIGLSSYLTPLKSRSWKTNSSVITLFTTLTGNQSFISHRVFTRTRHRTHLHSGHTLTLNLFTAHLTIARSVYQLSKVLLRFKRPCYMSRPLYYSWFQHHNNSHWRTVTVWI